MRLVDANVMHIPVPPPGVDTDPLDPQTEHRHDIVSVASAVQSDAGAHWGLGVLLAAFGQCLEIATPLRPCVFLFDCEDYRTISAGQNAHWLSVTMLWFSLSPHTYPTLQFWSARLTRGAMALSARWTHRELGLG
jgi:hypothetical protein